MKHLAPTLSALAVVFAISAMQVDDLGAEQAMADAHQAARHEALAQARLHQAQVALCVSVAGVGSTPVELEDGSFVCADSEKLSDNIKAETQAAVNRMIDANIRAAVKARFAAVTEQMGKGGV